MKKKILSLFDGISCTQIALRNIGVKDYRYFASEIEKNPIAITMKHFPDTLQIGDVKNIGRNTYMHRGNMMDYLDLIAGGSPCQGFSFSGKQLNFEDERSKLFFEFERIVKELKPKYFILENVFMKKQYQNIISERLFGVQPICINSEVASAGLRKRLYWVGFRKDDGSYEEGHIRVLRGQGQDLEEILEKNVSDDYYLTEEQIKLAEEKCKGRTFKTGSKNGSVMVCRDKKALCIIKTEFGKTNRQTNRVKDDKGVRILTIKEKERIMTIPDDYTAGFPNYIRQEMIGNGMTVKVMEYLLKCTIGTN